VTYQYNGVGLISTLTTPGSLNFGYTYNALNLLSTVSNPNGVSVSYTYDTNDGARLSRITRPGSYIDFQYNARNWITAVLNRKTDNSTLYDANYYYQDGSLWDHAGNPLKRVENFGGSNFTTTLRYDNVYRMTEETKRDSGGVVQYTLGYGYDAVGNRISRALGGTTITYSYDDNNKLTSANDGSSFGYDANGNMTSVSGPLGAKTLVYDDENRPTSLTSGGVTDLYYYNALGQRYRTRLGGTYWRYVYNGDRVLEETNDSGTVLARYTTMDPGFCCPLLHMWRSNGASRFPLYDMTGSARELVDASGAVTDTYTLDAFGRQISSTGSTTNPYKYDAAWGYITDPSSFQQLGARFYWPEVGRFVQQDPIGSGMNWYAYVGGNPVVRKDPHGLYTDTGEGWYWGSVAGWGDWIDSVVFNGSTAGFGDTAGRWDAGAASGWDLTKAAGGWGAKLGIAGWLGGQGLAAGNRALAMGGQVARWGPAGDWVMVGGNGPLNWLLAGMPYPYGTGGTFSVPPGSLAYPAGWECIKGLFGQRMLK